MISIPTPVTDPRNLADWLEIRAITAADHSASISDLRRALVAVGGDESIATGKQAGDDDEVLALSALAECEDRLRSAVTGYPFKIEGALLRVDESKESDSWVYLFCLALSLQGANRGDAEDSPTALFEEIAELAARTYVSGRSVKFGFPRRVLPTNFSTAVDHVCSEVGEGQRCRNRPSNKHAKDARLDIVAWRPFPDKRPAQMLLFGQCAAGGNWQEKLSELQPRDFTDLYWATPPLVIPIKAFFTPFRLGTDNWEASAKYGGILFERCRIAHFAAGNTPPPGVARWTSRTIKGFVK